MPYARIITVKKGTVIRCVKLEEGQSTLAVDQIANTLESIICEERDILTVEVSYLGCGNNTLD